MHDHQLHVEKLFDEPFVLAVPECSVLAGRKNIRLEDLADQNLLLLDDGHCLRDQALEVCQLAGAGEKSGFRATSLETLRQMVAANVGITLLPTLAVKPPVPQVEHIRLIEFRTRHPAGISPWSGERVRPCMNSSAISLNCSASCRTDYSIHMN